SPCRPSSPPEEALRCTGNRQLLRPAPLVAQKGQHGEHAAVVLGACRQPALGEDARPVAPARASPPPPRGQSPSSVPPRLRRPTSSDTTCGSNAVPPSATLRTASTKS